MQNGVKENRIIFEDGCDESEDTCRDTYGMPQPTFVYTPTRKFANQATDMMKE